LSTRGALSRLYPNREGKYYIGLSDDVSRRINQHNFDDSRCTRGKVPWILIWQSGEMNLSDARKLELSLKRQKGGDGFYRMIGLSGSAHNPAPAGPRVQIPPPQPIFCQLAVP
jgi:hypothetical protein